jgi:hypothetical protein
MFLFMCLYYRMFENVEFLHWQLFEMLNVHDQSFHYMSFMSIIGS